MIQCLHFHVECNQRGWAKALPKVHFDIMNTPNTSMGVLPFVLKTGRSPRLIPSLMTATPADSPPTETASVEAFMAKMEEQMNTARDSLLAAKISQVHATNKDHPADPAFKVGEKVLLATAHRCRDYMQVKDRRMAKFMPRFDGLYEILKAYPESLAYTLQLPSTSKSHPTFHVSHL